MFQIGSETPVYERAESTPAFNVANLRPATAYKLMITALNDKGASRATEVKIYTDNPISQEESSAGDTKFTFNSTAGWCQFFS